jgi:hypothetical protein
MNPEGWTHHHAVGLCGARRDVRVGSFHVVDVCVQCWKGLPGAHQDPQDAQEVTGDATDAARAGPFVEVPPDVWPYGPEGPSQDLHAALNVALLTGMAGPDVMTIPAFCDLAPLLDFLGMDTLLDTFRQHSVHARGPRDYLLLLDVAASCVHEGVLDACEAPCSPLPLCNMPWGFHPRVREALAGRLNMGDRMWTTLPVNIEQLLGGRVARMLRAGGPVVAFGDVVHAAARQWVLQDAGMPAPGAAGLDLGGRDPVTFGEVKLYVGQPITSRYLQTLVDAAGCSAAGVVVLDSQPGVQVRMAVASLGAVVRVTYAPAVVAPLALCHLADYTACQVEASADGVFASLAAVHAWLTGTTWQLQPSSRRRKYRMAALHGYKVVGEQGGGASGGGAGAAMPVTAPLEAHLYTQKLRERLRMVQVSVEAEVTALLRGRAQSLSVGPAPTPAPAPATAWPEWTLAADDTPPALMAVVPVLRVTPPGVRPADVGDFSLRLPRGFIVFPGMRSRALRDSTLPPERVALLCEARVLPCAGEVVGRPLAVQLELAPTASVSPHVAQDAAGWLGLPHAVPARFVVCVDKAAEAVLACTDSFFRARGAPLGVHALTVEVAWREYMGDGEVVAPMVTHARVVTVFLTS